MLVLLLFILITGYICVLVGKTVQLPEPDFHDYVINIGSVRFGFSHHLIGDDDPYLERWILWVGIGTLRIHKFHRGDDDRAPHNHPWAFITFPFKSYTELVFNAHKGPVYNQVKAFRFHYRPASYQHIVKIYDRKPIWTFVISGRRINHWGYFPYNPWLGKRVFVSWRNWK